MVAVNRTPTNLNYLSIIGWNLILHRAPHVEFFVQEAQIPEISLPPVEVPNPFVAQPYAGDHMEYNTLAVTFVVDESMQGYLELHNWITGLGFPKDYAQYEELFLKDRDPLDPEGIFSDISLTLLTNLKNSNREFIFRHAWPTSLSGWEMSNTIEDVQYAKCTATFAYAWFDIEQPQ